MLDITTDWEEALEKETTAKVREIIDAKRQAIGIVNKFWQKVEKSRYNPDIVIFHGPFYNGVPDDYSNIEISLIFSDPEVKWFRDMDEMYGLVVDLEADYCIMPRILKVYDDRPGRDVLELIKSGAIVHASDKGRAWIEHVHSYTERS